MNAITNYNVLCIYLDIHDAHIHTYIHTYKDVDIDYLWAAGSNFQLLVEE